MLDKRVHQDSFFGCFFPYLRGGPGNSVSRLIWEAIGMIIWLVEVLNILMKCPSNPTVDQEGDWYGQAGRP